MLCVPLTHSTWDCWSSLGPSWTHVYLHYTRNYVPWSEHVWSLCRKLWSVFIRWFSPNPPPYTSSTSSSQLPPTNNPLLGVNIPLHSVKSVSSGAPERKYNDLSSTLLLNQCPSLQTLFHWRINRCKTQVVYLDSPGDAIALHRWVQIQLKIHCNKYKEEKVQKCG